MAVVMKRLIFHTLAPQAVARLARPKEDERAGAREHFEDAALYDFEYRRRRADVNFYRRLAADRMAFGPGPIADLACGTGRLLLPLLRDGHTVVGLDRSRSMLEAAARRLARLSPARRRRALLVRGDLGAFSFQRRFVLAVCAFHSIQHLVTDAELLGFLRAVARSLRPGGWLALDVLPPDPVWVTTDQRRRARTIFRHPVTRERFVYTTDRSYDSVRRALHMRLYYQRLDGRGRSVGPERVVRLCHRQLWPADVKRLLARAGFRLIGAFADFAGSPLPDGDGLPADEHVYVARAIR
jgi:SAM-dependent methyltransferase